MSLTPAGRWSPEKKRSYGATPSIRALGDDVLCILFSMLGFFDLVRCSVVCKSWNRVINRSKLLEVLYYKQRWGSTSSPDAVTLSGSSMNSYLEGLAMENHRLSLLEGCINIDQWRGHSVGVDQCRLKRGLILTGVGDKVMRLWSLDSYERVEEYSIPDAGPLLDFDFDESKIVGLVGTRICIWRRDGKRSIFPSRDGTFPKGLCMRYYDPEAVVGCEDGTARVFDMYSRKCSRIIRMHSGPVTCLSLSDDQLILSGSSLGSITISGLSSDQKLATLRSTDLLSGIRTLCFNPRSHLAFAGSTSGYASCWDLRTMRALWERRVSSNAVYSVQYLQNDTSILVVGGIDGILRILDQNTGETLSSCVIEGNPSSSSSKNTNGIVERNKARRLPEDANIDKIPRMTRPPITCLAVGMKKVVTTHNGKYIKTWKFNR